MSIDVNEAWVSCANGGRIGMLYRTKCRESRLDNKIGYKQNVTTDPTRGGQSLAGITKIVRASLSEAYLNRYAAECAAKTMVNTVGTRRFLSQPPLQTLSYDTCVSKTTKRLRLFQGTKKERKK